MNQQGKKSVHLILVFLTILSLLGLSSPILSTNQYASSMNLEVAADTANDLRLPPIREKRFVNLTEEISTLGGESETFMFTLGNFSANIVLVRNRLFSVNVKLQHILCYKGKVEGYSESSVRLTVDQTKRTMEGYIAFGGENPTYEIEAEEETKNIRHYVYRGDGESINPSLNIQPPTPQEREAYTPPRKEFQRNSNSLTSVSNSLFQTRRTEYSSSSIQPKMIDGGDGGDNTIDLEWDISLDTNHGYDDDWESTINEIEGIYEDELEVGFNIIISDIERMWIGADTAEGILDEFVADEGSIEGDKAVLITNARPGTTLGMAYVTESPYWSYAWFTTGDTLYDHDRRERLVGAHELGHNWGCRHDDAIGGIEDGWVVYIGVFPFGYSQYRYSIMYKPYYGGPLHKTMPEFSEASEDEIEEHVSDSRY